MINCVTPWRSIFWPMLNFASLVLKLYLNNRRFYISIDTKSNIRNVEPLPYLICTADLFQQVTIFLEQHMLWHVLFIHFIKPSNCIPNQNRPNLWLIEVNRTKSQHISFSLHAETCPSISMNNTKGVF